MSTVLISGVLQFILGVMAMAMTTHPEKMGTRPSIILTIYIIVSIFLVGVAVLAAREQDQQNQIAWDNVTGGNSYPAIIPQVPNPNGTRLVISNRGDHILSGVSILIRNLQDYSEQREEVGTLSAPMGFRILSNIIKPNVGESAPVINGEHVDSYWIQITAQNGLYIEVLQFKKGKCSPWTYRYWIDKDVFIRQGKQVRTEISRLENETDWHESCPKVE